jgi:hypothetical protein
MVTGMLDGRTIMGLAVGAALSCLVFGLSGCRGGGEGQPSAASPTGRTAGTSPPGTATSSSPGADSPGPAARSVPRRLDAADFPATPAGANEWLPLTPGLQWVRQGSTEVGHRPIPHRVVSTVTDVTRRIAGVQTLVVLDQDVDAGQVAQQSLDYFATDTRGNVWYLGGYTEQYEGGRFVSAQDAWLAGTRGAKAGVLMPANPRPGPRWTIAQPPGEDGDAAEVVRTGVRKCVPFGCFDDVLVVREGKASALDNEFKFYAPGLGQILNTPRSLSAHKDVEALQNVTQLSPRGLAELSREALRLDRHAADVSPEVFDSVRAARLTG